MIITDYLKCASVLTSRTLCDMLMSPLRQQLATVMQRFLFSQLGGLYDHFLQVSLSLLCVLYTLFILSDHLATSSPSLMHCFHSIV